MDHNGTPLEQAVCGSRNAPHYTSDLVPLVKFLLENGADPNRISSPYYNGPGVYLEGATRRSPLEIIELLLKHGAEISQSGAIQQAAERGRID
ncbi:hypothetical protein BKA66DRAFT_377789, partial [Pyrenochaeta sp. MPI-SDFR-AT-0127]